MTFTVLLFARYRELAGAPSLRIESEGNTLADVWTALRRAVPALSSDERPLFSCDHAYARADRTLTGREEIAIFPPVGGG